MNVAFSQPPFELGGTVTCPTAFKQIQNVVLG